MTPEERAAKLYEELCLKPPEVWRQLLGSAIRDALMEREEAIAALFGMPLLTHSRPWHEFAKLRIAADAREACASVLQRILDGTESGPGAGEAEAATRGVCKEAMEAIRGRGG